MSDPFPEEKMQVYGNVKAPMYHIDVYKDARYTPDHSPSVIYIPTKTLMIKMMRACIAVDDPADLWFNN
jgi:hypothetical protein